MNRELIIDSIKKMHHRGPDRKSIYVDENVSLGFARLAINDLTSFGDQPMENENGDIILIFNGEIYNFQELRRDLKNKGHKFKSESDAEVIIHSYEEEGIC
jgi:asparagine synthase (glutamine-hydrolysing)